MARTTPWDPSTCRHDAGRTTVETPDWVEVICDKCGRALSPAEEVTAMGQHRRGDLGGIRTGRRKALDVIAAKQAAKTAAARVAEQDASDAEVAADLRQQLDNDQ